MLILRTYKITLPFKNWQKTFSAVSAPFDIVGRLSNKKALRVAVNFDVVARVNGDGTRAVFLRANF